ncbi:unnamed protein product [Symbiodinium sp. CCMP2456]|nr:unnamed protein product [Symbiodinium sp. CCMP2456]
MLRLPPSAVARRIAAFVFFAVASHANTDLAVDKMALVDAVNDIVIAEFDPLESGTTLYLDELPAQINVVATTLQSVGSMRFKVNGNHFRTETNPPFAMAGDSSGNYHDWGPSPGTYLIGAQAFENAGGNGDSGTEHVIVVTVAATRPVTTSSSTTSSSVTTSSSTWTFTSSSSTTTSSSSASLTTTSTATVSSTTATSLTSSSSSTRSTRTTTSTASSSSTTSTRTTTSSATVSSSTSTSLTSSSSSTTSTTTTPLTRTVSSSTTSTTSLSTSTSLTTSTALSVTSSSSTSATFSTSLSTTVSTSSTVLTSTSSSVSTTVTTSTSSSTSTLSASSTFTTVSSSITTTAATSSSVTKMPRTSTSTTSLSSTVSSSDCNTSIGVPRVLLPDSLMQSPHGEILSKSLEAASTFFCEDGGLHGTTTAVGAVTAIKLTAQTDPVVLDLNTSEDSLPMKIVLPQSLLQVLLQSGNAMMVFTEVAAELAPAFAVQGVDGEDVVLSSRLVELSFISENAGSLTLLNVSGSEGIVFSFASRAPLEDERCGFFDPKLGAWSEEGVEFLAHYEVHGESINRSWCRTTHTSLFALLQTLPVDRAIGAGAFIDVKSYAGAVVLCVNFAVICCLLLCIVLLRRVRKPTTGHVKLVTQRLVHGHKAKVRTLSFKLSDLPGEVDVEGGPAAQPKVHVRWDEDLSILEDLHYLRRGRRQVVVNLNIGPPQRKVDSADSYRDPLRETVRPQCSTNVDAGAHLEREPSETEPSSQANELVLSSLDEAVDVISAGVDDLYFLETDSIVSAGLDGFVLYVPPSEAYLEGEWVLYFSSTLACMVPARVAGPGTFQSEDPSELPSYACRVGLRNQLREAVPLRALRPVLQAGEHVEVYSEKAWMPGVVRTTPPSRRPPHLWTFRVRLEDQKRQDLEVPLSMLRRRFLAGEQVEAYLGRGAGWVSAIVSDTVVEIPLATTWSQRSEASMTSVPSILDMDLQLANLDTTVRIFLDSSKQEVELPTSQLRSCRQSKL